VGRRRQAYLRDEGRSNWDGELFVFDDRLATPNIPKVSAAPSLSLLSAQGARAHRGGSLTHAHRRRWTVWRRTRATGRAFAAHNHWPPRRITTAPTWIATGSSCAGPSPPTFACARPPRADAASLTRTPLTARVQRLPGVHAAAPGPLQRGLHRLRATQTTADRRGTWPYPSPAYIPLVTPARRERRTHARGDRSGWACST
jgi:hypothetical protein